MPVQPDLKSQEEKGKMYYDHMKEDLEELIDHLPRYYNEFAQYNGMSYRAMLKLFKPLSEVHEALDEMNKRYVDNVHNRMQAVAAKGSIPKRSRNTQ